MRFVLHEMLVEAMEYNGGWKSAPTSDTLLQGDPPG